MKKFLLFFMSLFMSMTVWAESVDFSAQGYTNSQEITTYTGTDFTVTFDKGTNSNTPKYYTTGTAIRVYGGGYFTVTSSKTISKIEIGFGSGDGTNTITTDVETYTNGTWEGSASSVKFNIGGTTGHRRIKTLNVTFSGETPPPATYYSVTLPNSLTGGTVTANVSNLTQIAEGTTVTITATPETDYELDWMKVNDEEVTNPYSFTINEDKIVTAAFKEKSITEVSTIADLNALDDNTEFKFTGNTICIWSYGQYTYIQDGTAATLIYGTLPEGIAYNITDVIPGGWQGKKVTYNNLPEVKNVSDLVESTTTQNIPATEITLPNISTDDFAKYIVIKDVLITVNTPEPPEPPTPGNHELTYGIIGVTGTSYTAWSNIQGGTSTAKYAGKTAGGNEAIQMRSSKNEDGIVTISSAGNVQSITLTWNKNTAATRTVSIYGKNEPYASAADLYNNDTRGDLLGELCIDNASTSTTITVDDNYAYWGIRSKSGALYLDAIDVEWSNASKAQSVEEAYTLTDQNGNTITAYPSKLGYMEVPDDLTQRYNVYGVLDYHNGQPEILPIGFEDNNGTITYIETFNSDIKKVLYYNMQGIESTKPFNGINIIVKTYSDGSQVVTKELRK